MDGISYVGGIYEVDKNSGGSVTQTRTYYPVGSANIVTNSAGVLQGNQHYPYGERRVTSGSMFTDRLFTSQRETAGLEIYHYGMRFYSPKLGRFLSADTLVPYSADPQNLNHFSYVLNNPLRYTDPRGYCRDRGGCRHGDDRHRRLGAGTPPTPTVGAPLTTATPRGPIPMPEFGSSLAGAPASPGPAIGGRYDDPYRYTQQMKAWNDAVFPAAEYQIIPSAYPGYVGDHPSQNRNVGKSRQGLAMDAITGNADYAVAVGYSSGVHTALLYGQERNKRDLSTDLILIGPPVAGDHPRLYWDTNLVVHTEADFIFDLKAFADSGNHILIIDEARHFTMLAGYPNITYVPVILVSPDPHQIISDIPAAAQSAYQWLNNNYIWPSGWPP